MKSILYALLALFAITTLFSCSGDSLNIRPPDLVEKKYAHLLFETEVECREAQKSGFINCAQLLEIKDDKTANLIVTDIINEATYFVVTNRLVLQPTENAYEFDDEIIFIVKPNHTLIRADNETKWKEYNDSIWE